MGLEWIKARLREDNSRAAIGQLSLLAAIVAVALGLDLDHVLTQAEAYTNRILAMTAIGAAVAVQVQRILTPDKSAAVVPVPELLEIKKSFDDLKTLTKIVKEVQK